MDGQIVKAEILWTRKCNLNCSYCAMNTGIKNRYSGAKWIKGVQNLITLGCKFIAFYGAEPLFDSPFTLGEVIQYAEDNHIDTTVITNASLPDTDNILEMLVEKGLRSLTVSYDLNYVDKSSRIKSEKALQALDLFRGFCPEYRDVAVVTTVTRKNYHLLTDSVERMTEKGIWSFFDIFHPDRGQPGSKCKNFPNFGDYMFTNQDDILLLKDVMAELIDMKKKGFLVHASESFLEHLRSGIRTMNDLYSWNCAKDYDTFPSWITIDCNGFVYPCDDFQPISVYKESPILFHEIAKRWDEFKTRWIGEVYNKCPGCCWNTHMDAHAIKEGRESISGYIHGE